MPMLIEFDEYISPDGLSFQFNDLATKFLMSGFSNQGMSPIEYKTQRGPVQHGESVVAYTLRPRQVQAVFRWNGADRFDFWEKRGELLDILRPNRGSFSSPEPGILRKHLPGGVKRDLYVFINNSPNFTPSNDQNWDEFSVKDVIRFTAYDPLFYDPDLNTVNPGTLLADNLVFPFTFPLIFGAGVLTGTASITYTGTFLTYPTIILVGPLTNAQITNQTTGEQIRLLYSIAAGQQVTIDLRYGSKLVTDNLGNNLLGVVSTDSDLGTFHIAPSGEVLDGINTFFASADGANGGSSITISYYRRYIGI